MRTVKFGVVLLASMGTIAANAATINLGFTVRDFDDTHPDMEGAIGGLDTDAVMSTLGGDGKPVFNAAGAGVAFSNAANFNQWYNDVAGVNLSTGLSLTLDNTISADPNVYTYSSNAFFPIDNQLLGNQGRPHNYHFTMEHHSTFTYQGGETFSFTGDDDLWVFINGKLAVDLGGVHGAVNGSVDLDTAAAAWGLTVGNDYTFDLFFAERHTTQSNFRIDTSIQLQQAVPIPAAAWLFGSGLIGLVGISKRRQRS